MLPRPRAAGHRPGARPDKALAIYASLYDDRGDVFYSWGRTA